MIHNHNQNTRFRSITDCFYCIVMEEIKIFFNLPIIIRLYLSYTSSASTCKISAVPTNLQVALSSCSSNGMGIKVIKLSL